MYLPDRANGDRLTRVRQVVVDGQVVYDDETTLHLGRSITEVIAEAEGDQRPVSVEFRRQQGRLASAWSRVRSWFA